MYKRFVEIKHKSLAALLVGALRSEQVLVAEVHATVVYLDQVVVLLGLLCHLRRSFALRNLAHELTKLVSVYLLMALIGVLLLLLLHLLLLALARVLAALLPRVRRFGRLVVASHTTSTFASTLLTGSRLVRLHLLLVIGGVTLLLLSRLLADLVLAISSTRVMVFWLF